VTTVGDEVTGIVAEVGDKFDGVGAFEKVFGPAEKRGDEGGIGRRAEPVGPETGRAVDDGDTGPAGGGEEPGDVGEETDAVDLLSQDGEAREVADDTALEFHGDNGGLSGTDQVGERKGHGLRWRRTPR